MILCEKCLFNHLSKVHKKSRFSKITSSPNTCSADTLIASYSLSFFCTTFISLSSFLLPHQLQLTTISSCVFSCYSTIMFDFLMFHRIPKSLTSVDNLSYLSTSTSITCFRHIVFVYIGSLFCSSAMSLDACLFRTVFVCWQCRGGVVCETFNPPRKKFVLSGGSCTSIV
ncbi:hypothetical protein B0J14DRAFT_67205 [Halenospora varia]|nr:hypothetical protein B0J14DRAFT_67205 [Halenospora varia]